MIATPWSLDPFKGIRKHAINPDPKRMVEAFSRIGYKLEEAVADVIDNAIDAGAEHVLIRFFLSDSSIQRIAILNDGQGLTETEIDDAMQFGVDMNKPDKALGKFGMGLKTASFSQCKSVSLLSRHKKDSAGRRWTVDSISEGWLCDDIDHKEVKELLDRDWGVDQIDLSEKGTLVVWDDLDNQRIDRGHGDVVTSKYLPSLQKHIGLVFHRFLSDGRIRIQVDAVDADTGVAGCPNEIFPMDPFSYAKSGAEGYPTVFQLPFKGFPKLHLEAHIWPSNSKDTGYKLGGGRVAERQGFYFYRNDRLIQAGGWNNWRESDAEPHTSLARVKIELPAAFDGIFRLNVQKSKLDVPPVFLESLDSVQSDGKTLQQYVQDANNVYRAGKEKKIAQSRTSPGLGVPYRVRRIAKQMESPLSRTGLKVSIGWKRLPENIFFKVDNENSKIWINREFRESIKQDGLNDLGLFKTLLYLLLRNEVKRERIREDHQWVLETINQELLSAINRV
jgi:hypothetical protein